MTRISLKWRLLITVLSLTILSQAAFLYLNVRTFQNAYETEMRSNLQTVGANLKENLVDILNKGMPLQKLVGLDALFKDILGDAPNIGFIALGDPAGRWLYYCDREYFLQESEWLQIKQDLLAKTNITAFPLVDKNQKEQGRLLLAMDQKQAARAIRIIALDSGTIALIAVLATLDLLFFCIAFAVLLPLKRAENDIQATCGPGLPNLAVRRTGISFMDLLLDHYDQYRLRFTQKWLALLKAAAPLLPAPHPSAPERAAGREPSEFATKLGALLARFHFQSATSAPTDIEALPALIRPAVFLFIFAESLSISFLPLFAKDIYHPMGNLSEKVVLGLPISAFMLLTALSMPVGGGLSDRIGRNRTFIIGAFITALGHFLSGTADHILNLILYRALAGLGFGLVFMTAQGYIIDTTSEAGRAEGMAVFLSAFYGGTLCGSGIGGMLADRLGFRFLFYIGAVFALLSAFFVHRFTPETAQSGHGPHGNPAAPAEKRPFTNLITLMTDRKFMSLTLLQSIPNKICLIGLVYYIAPLWFKSMGISQSDAGRYIMGYSLCMILFSQTLSRWSDRFRHPKPFIVFGGVLSGLALVLCYFYAGAAAIAAAILLLGLAHALAVSNQAKLASQLEVMQQVGLGVGLGIYRQAERIGNVLAPICLGLMITSWGYGESLAVLGIFTVCAGLLFGILFVVRPEMKK